jgi:hypothetical protein
MSEMNPSAASPTGLTTVDEVAGGGRTLVVTSRLLMGANTTLQLTLLFAYLYLRANNFGGMWHPDGVNPPPEVIALAALVVPIVGVAALWAATAARARGGVSASSLRGLLTLALVAAILTGAVRIFLMYQFSWDVTNGTYIDISTLWYAVILAEFIIVGLWLMSLTLSHIRGTDPISTAQVRAVLEQWTYVTVVAVAVYLLVEFLT